mgnify:CR=1 FL=1
MIYIKKVSVLLFTVALVACSQQTDNEKEVSNKGEVITESISYSIDGLALNNGEKWTTDKETDRGFHEMLSLINSFSKVSTVSVKEYQNFGLEMDVIKGEILSQCTMTGLGHDHLHTLLVPLIRKINGIKEVTTLEKAEVIFDNIKSNVELYDDFFTFD